MIAILASLALTLAIGVYVFYPSRTTGLLALKTRLEYLGERKEAVYENLRDLNFEYRAGKYPEEDYAAQRAQLENEAAEVLAEIDSLESRHFASTSGTIDGKSSGLSRLAGSPPPKRRRV